MNVDSLNFVLALGTAALQMGAFALLVAHFQPSFIPRVQKIKDVVEKWALWIGFVLALGGSAMTLFYSDVLGFEPCPLCWWQRIFLYPQVILFALALWKSDFHKKSAVDLSIALSAIGAGFALYQHLLQMLPAGSLPCPATGVSCAQRIVFELGYITFPLMAFSLFAFLIALMLIIRRRVN